MVQHTHLIFFLVTSTLHKQPRIIDFFHGRDFSLEEFHGVLSKTKRSFIDNIKDTCDGSGLNTIDSSVRLCMLTFSMAFFISASALFSSRSTSESRSP